MTFLRFSFTNLSLFFSKEKKFKKINILRNFMIDVIVVIRLAGKFKSLFFYKILCFLNKIFFKIFCKIYIFLTNKDSKNDIK